MGVLGERGRGAGSSSTHPLMEGEELSRVLSSQSPGEINQATVSHQTEK